MLVVHQIYVRIQINKVKLLNYKMSNMYLFYNAFNPFNIFRAPVIFFTKPVILTKLTFQYVSFYILNKRLLKLSPVQNSCFRASKIIQCFRVTGLNLTYLNIQVLIHWHWSLSNIPLSTNTPTTTFTWRLHKYISFMRSTIASTVNLHLHLQWSFYQPNTVGLRTWFRHSLRTRLF